MNNLKNEIKSFINDESGQAVTEYGAVLAVAALFIGALFSAVQGTILPVLTSVFSNSMGGVNQLAATAST